jgi:signal transduction histidine kinase
MSATGPEPTSYVDPRPFSIWRPKWFLITRYLAVVGVIAAIATARYFFILEGPDYHSLSVLAAVLLASNIGYHIYYLTAHVSKADVAGVSFRRLAVFTKVQINSDLVLLTFMLHYAGGATNPVILYYFFHTILSSILLKKHWAYFEATVAAGLFNSMVFLEGFEIIRHNDLFHTGVHTNPTFMLGMVLAMTSALYIAVYMASSIMDLLRSHQRELEHSLVEIKRLEHEKSTFLSVVSHDLKGPIAAIESLATSVLAVHGDGMMPKVREVLERIPTRTRDLTRFIRDLLEFSHITSLDDTVETLKPLNLLPMVSATVEIYMSQAEEKHITVTVTADPDLPDINGSHDLLDRMVGNLISNAVRYTPDNGSVTITLERSADDLVFTVADTGIGIPEADIPSIFNEFYRASNAKKFTTSGTGLGMAITKAVVDRHGGTITVKSVVGEGTTFTVRISGIS